MTITQKRAFTFLALAVSGAIAIHSVLTEEKRPRYSSDPSVQRLQRFADGTLSERCHFIASDSIYIEDYQEKFADCINR